MVPVETVKAGDTLICDGGFTCVNEGEHVVIYEDEAGLYFLCCKNESSHYGKSHDEARTQHHYLDGQLDAEQENYVGFIGWRKG